MGTRGGAPTASPMEELSWDGPRWGRELLVGLEDGRGLQTDLGFISLPTSVQHLAALPSLPPGWHRTASSITFWHLDCSCGLTHHVSRSHSSTTNS